ncbi:hypothetical protein Tco_0833420, partial [Tanacetum coccineum]
MCFHTYQYGILPMINKEETGDEVQQLEIPTPTQDLPLSSSEGEPTTISLRSST